MFQDLASAFFSTPECYARASFLVRLDDAVRGVLRLHGQINARWSPAHDNDQ
jgi:hypothetical protein